MGTKIATGLKARLHRAESEQTAVAVTRAIRRADGLDGYVVGIGTEWLCIAVLNCNRLNGFAAVRLADVQRVQTLREDALHRTALTSVGQWPPATPLDPIDLASTRGLVATAHAEKRLVSIYVERVDPDEFFVGVPAKPSGRRLVLDEITPRGTWDDTVSEWPFGAITRVEWGSTYEEDLQLVGGLPSNRPEPS